MPMHQEQVEKAAREIHSWAQSAVYDVAECVEWSESGAGFGDDYGAREAKADDLYDDADTMQDLLGDKCHDEAHGDWNDMLAILKELKKYYRYGGGGKAVDALIKSTEEYITKMKG